MEGGGIIRFLRPSSSSLKAKKSSTKGKKSRGKTKTHEETEATRGNLGQPRSWQRPRSDRSGHYLGRSPASRMHRFGELPYIAVCALDQPSWAYWASFASSLDLIWPQCLYFRWA